MNLLQRQMNILKYLKTYPDWHTGKDLVTLFNVSIRTIRNDIQTINESAKQEIIQSSKSYGYRIDASLAKGVDIQSDNDIYADRQLKILLKLTINYQSSFDIYDLAQELYISEHTLMHDIQALRSEIMKYPSCSLYLQKKKNLIFLEGTLENSARLMQVYLKNTGKFQVFSSFQNSFQYVNFDTVSEVIKLTLGSSLYTRHITFDDIKILSCIFLEQSFYIDNLDTAYEHNHEIYFQELKMNLENFFVSIHENFPNANIDYFRKQFIAHVFPFIRLEEKEYRLQQSTTQEDPLYPHLVTIFREVKELFGLDVTEHEKLILNFLVHIKSTLLQIDEGIDSNNPLLEYIRLNYTFLFDVAFYISNRLSDYLGYQFSSAETSFFVVYLISPLKSMKENILLNYQVDILLYVVEGPSVMQNIMELLKGKIENSHVNIEMLSSSLEFKNINLNHFDVLITTATYLYDNAIEICVVQPFVTALNLKNINQTINKIYVKKKQKHFHQLFSFFFNSETFFFLKNSNKPSDVISCVSQKLINLNYVPEDFESQILEREALISTAFETGVALPHTITNSAFKSNISFVKLKSPINWGGQRVKSIFLFAIANEDLNYLNLIYKLIINICSSSVYSDALHRCDTFENLEALLFELYNEL